MSNVLGELFGNIANAIREKTGEPASATMKPAEFPAKIGAIGKTTILASTKYEGFEMSTDFGCLTYGVSPAPFELKLGESYDVVWDGRQWTCDAQDLSGLVPGAVAIGNLTNLDANGNGEDFAIGYVNGMIILLDLLNKSTEHTVAIYQESKVVSNDVRYVTFMSYDGKTKYGVKPVAVGDDCADPIARGVFTTPTRESTAQYNYTFAGWSTVVNGGLDSNALKAVNEDRTVYANFAAVVRTYTITYYDEDGTTVLKTDTMTYGSMPSYTPIKDAYEFVRWEPALATVVSDASYVSVWEMAAQFATMSWEEIAEICDAGNASQYFSLGDTKNVIIDLPSGAETIPFEIVDLDATNDIYSGSAHIALIAKVALNNPATYNSKYFTQSTKAWGYYNSNIRTYINDSIFPYFPEDLKTVMKTVCTNNGGHYYDKLAIPTANAIVGFEYDDYSNPSNVSQNGNLEAFKSTSNDIRIRKTADGTAVSYWLATVTVKTPGQGNTYASAPNYINSAGRIAWGGDESESYARHVVLMFLI